MEAVLLNILGVSLQERLYLFILKSIQSICKADLQSMHGFCRHWASARQARIDSPLKPVKTRAMGACASRGDAGRPLKDHALSQQPEITH